MQRMLSRMLGVLKSSDVAIPNVVKSAKSSSLAPKTEKTEATDDLYCIAIFITHCARMTILIPMIKKLKNDNNNRCFIKE